MYAATTGTFLQRDPIGDTRSPLLGYSHRTITHMMRNRRHTSYQLFGYGDGPNLYAAWFVPNATDPFGLELVGLFDGDGKVIGQKDTSRVNCLGYACRKDFHIQPSRNGSLKTLMEGLGYTCHGSGDYHPDKYVRYDTPSGCKKRCKCDDYLFLYVYIPKNENLEGDALNRYYDQQRKLMSGTDWYESTSAWKYLQLFGTTQIDIHGLRGGGTEDDPTYLDQMGTAPKGGAKDVTTSPEWARKPWRPDWDTYRGQYFSPERIYATFCCCKKR